ncbi:MAG TPA: hypothetical protein VGP72_16455 [Planctomycetota bacterium]|jgi:hypothetical protein
MQKYNNSLFLTCGVREFCDQKKCWWFLDVIFSYQAEARKDPMLHDCQFWHLTVRPDRTATVRCDRDKGNTAFSQEIPFTDFPDAEGTLWVEYGEVEEGKPCWVILRPEEH